MNNEQVINQIREGQGLVESKMNVELKLLIDILKLFERLNYDDFQD